MERKARGRLDSEGEMFGAGVLRMGLGAKEEIAFWTKLVCKFLRTSL